MVIMSVRLVTTGDRAFLVAGSRVWKWKRLPLNVQLTPSVDTRRMLVVYNNALR